MRVKSRCRWGESQETLLQLEIVKRGIRQYEIEEEAISLACVQLLYFAATESVASRDDAWQLVHSYMQAHIEAAIVLEA